MTTADIANFHAFEELAKSIAQRLIKRHEPFRAQPTPDGHGGTVIGWLRSLGRKGVSQSAATHMLREDLEEASLALRAKIAACGQDKLGEARAAVLLYLALLPEIGLERVLRWEAMWIALRAGDWDEAADALLLTEWPEVMTGTREKVVRGVALQRVIRTGKQFTDADERRLSFSRAPG